MPSSWKDLGRLRSLETVILVVFLLTATAGSVLALIPRSTSTSTYPDPTIKVFAYHMPNQGWAPLNVYFSPFGSYAPESKILRYEWDLDGNGSFETDATSSSGYTQYTYAKPGEYSVTLQVTDEDGGTATDSVLVSVRHPAASSVDYWTVFDDTQIRRVDLIVSQANWDRMWLEPG